MSQKVFVVFARSDQRRRAEVCKGLRSMLPANVAICSLNPRVTAAKMRNSIREQIELSIHVLVFWTAEAAGAPEVFYQVAMAEALGKPVTILKEGSSPALPEAFDIAQVVDMTKFDAGSSPVNHPGARLVIQIMPVTTRKAKALNMA
jgi:hypothetical protein